MDYWISSKNVQMGPYSLDQLRLMWQAGKLTSDTFYFESIRSEWLLLKTLVENNRQLFTVEEAFVRLGQNRQKGCLIVFNKEEEMHLFTEEGFIICALGRTERGEIAVAQALHLEDASYDWIQDAKPSNTNLRLHIHEYALKNAIARDVHFSRQSTSKKHTVTLSKAMLDKVETPLKFHYFLVPEAAPQTSLRLIRMTNVLGREDHCDVIVGDPQVSRKHCMLEASEQHVRVKDLESSNGTSINGIPITEGFLRVGDMLSLGSYKLLLHKEQKRAPDFIG